VNLDEALAEVPLVAILRGLEPAHAIETGTALVAAGIRVIEVPLNSPSPLVSISLLASEFGARIVCGAGTVLRPEEVDAVASAGGQVVVSPNADPRVIHRSLALGLEPFPGFFTPTEAFTAIEAGAVKLKLFPAASAGPAYLRALRVVLPEKIQVFAVGGVRPEDMATWRTAGAAGFGLGSELYRPGQAADITLANARHAVAAASTR
jgi:2-dehydro-3-deoxyphosphogalactonate aldolase